MNTRTIWGAHIKARDEALSPQDHLTAIKRCRQADKFTEELIRRLPLLDLKAAAWDARHRWMTEEVPTLDASMALEVAASEADTAVMEFIYLGHIPEVKP